MCMEGFWVVLVWGCGLNCEVDCVNVGLKVFMVLFVDFGLCILWF